MFDIFSLFNSVARETRFAFCADTALREVVDTDFNSGCRALAVRETVVRVEGTETRSFRSSGNFIIAPPRGLTLV